MKMKHSQNILINEKLLFYHRTLSKTDDFRYLHVKEINFRLLNQQQIERMSKSVLSGLKHFWRMKALKMMRNAIYFTLKTLFILKGNPNY